MGVVLSAVGMSTLLGAGLQVHHLQQRAWIAPDRSVLAVIRGYGGQATGDIAVDTVEQELTRASAGADGVLAALAAASARLHAAPADAAPRLASVTIAVLDATGATATTVLHVGGNAAYLLRAGSLRRLTADHTFDANHGRYHRRVLVQVLGADREDIARTDVTLLSGDRLVLANDTIVRALTDDELVATTGAGDPDTAARALVALAHQRVDDDSATAIVAAFA